MAWSTAKKVRERERAERLGQLQKFVVSSWLFPMACVVVFVLVAGLAVGAVESLF